MHSLEHVGTERCSCKLLLSNVVLAKEHLAYSKHFEVRTSYLCDLCYRRKLGLKKGTRWNALALCVFVA